MIIKSREIYRMIGKYEETIEHFNKSLKIEPNDAFELRNQGGNSSCIR